MSSINPSNLDHTYRVLEHAGIYAKRKEILCRSSFFDLVKYAFHEIKLFFEKLYYSDLRTSEDILKHVAALPEIVSLNESHLDELRRKVEAAARGVEYLRMPAEGKLWQEVDKAKERLTQISANLDTHHSTDPFED